MDMSFRNLCQGLINRMQQSGASGRPQLRRRQMWLVEGLEARTLLSSTPAMVADINPGSAPSNPAKLVAIGSTTYFIANDGVHGNELWRSDGTAAATSLVADIVPGSTGSYPANLTNVNGTLFFTASDGTHGAELWKSNGTAAGTMLVADINPGSGSYPTGLTNVNGTLFFAADDGTTGNELWKSDGTAAGTTLVKDVLPGAAIYNGYYTGYSTIPNSSNPGSLTNVNGTLFFSANDGTGGYALWKSDGTAAGTVEVSTAAFNANNLINVNGTLFFSAYDGEHGQELWKSDGTAAGTTIVKDIFPGTMRYYYPYGGYRVDPDSSNPDHLQNVNGMLFFTACDGTHGYELWRSDGTDAGTVMVRDINPGGISSNPYQLTDVNGALFFSADDGTHGTELWKSDGTTAGTALVADIYPGAPASNPGSLANVNGTLFFSAYYAAGGQELWKSDGTAAGTVLVADINPGVTVSYRGFSYPNSSNPTNLTNANGVLLFTANDGVHGTELWSLNTAPAPSLAVSGFPATTTAGVVGSFSVTAKNADGSTNTGYTGTIHFTSSDPQAVLPANYTFTAADAGVHIFSFSATLKTAGTQSITARDTTTASLIGTDGNITVTPAAASKFLITVPSSIKAGIAFSLTLTVEDVYGNIVTGYTGTVHFTSSDKSALLPANYTFSSSDKGVHTFTGLVLRKKGKQTITITDILNSGLAASVTENVN